MARLWSCRLHDDVLWKNQRSILAKRDNLLACMESAFRWSWELLSIRGTFFFSFFMASSESLSIQGTSFFFVASSASKIEGTHLLRSTRHDLPWALPPLRSPLELASSSSSFLSSAQCAKARMVRWAHFYTRITSYLDQSELFPPRFDQSELFPPRFDQPELFPPRFDQSELFPPRFNQSDLFANTFRPITDLKTFAKAKPTRIGINSKTVE